jgi:hypothetical protein
MLHYAVPSTLRVHGDSSQNGSESSLNTPEYIRESIVNECRLGRFLISGLLVPARASWWCVRIIHRMLEMWLQITR